MHYIGVKSISRAKEGSDHLKLEMYCLQNCKRNNKNPPTQKSISLQGINHGDDWNVGIQEMRGCDAMQTL